MIKENKTSLKRSTATDTTNRWVDSKKDMNEELAPRQCFKCTEGIWAGHVIEQTGNTYCSTCFSEQFNKETQERMYKEEEQYYTEWDETDFQR